MPPSLLFSWYVTESASTDGDLPLENSILKRDWGGIELTGV